MNLEIVYVSNINEVMVGVSGFQFQLKKKMKLFMALFCGWVVERHEYHEQNNTKRSVVKLNGFFVVS